MTDEYLFGTVGEATVTRSNRSYGRAAGLPSPSSDYEHKVVNIFNGRWRVGEPLRYTPTVANGFNPDIIPSITKFVEQQGILGEPVAFADATYVGGTTTITIPDADAADLTADWHVWIYESASGGTPLTVGVYRIASGSGSDFVLDDELGTTPSASNGTASGYLLKSLYAEVYNAIPAPSESSARDQIAANNDSEISMSPWHDYGFWLPPATLVGGGRVKISMFGRIRMNHLAGRPTLPAETGGGAVIDGCYSNTGIGKAYLYLTVDPFSSSLVYYDHTHTEALFKPQRVSILKWTPENKFTSPTLVADTGTLELRSTTHEISTGDVVCVVSADPDDNTNVPTNIEVGAHYYAYPASSSTANRFRLTTSRNEALDDDPAHVVASGGEANPVVVARLAHRGSPFCLTWRFEFTTADEIADYKECELEIVGFGDGRTVNTEEGTKWTATLIVRDTPEKVGIADRITSVNDGTEKRWSGSLVRTSPGTSMDEVFGGDEPAASGAPYRLAKLRYFTAPDVVEVLVAGPELGASADGTAETVTHPYFCGLKPGDRIDITDAGTTGLTPGTFYSRTYGTTDRTEHSLNQSDGTTQATFNSSTDDIEAEFYPSYAAYWPSFWDYGGNYDIVQLDAALEAGTIGSGTTTVAGVAYWPIGPTYQGSEVIGFADTRKNSSAVRRATITEVEVGGAVVGEVCFYDNTRRLAFVRMFTPGEHIQNGDALTFKTYANERTTTAWSFNSTAKQTVTADALLVKHGPQGTRLSMRVAMGGPPTGDCQLDLRGGSVEIQRVRSR